MRLRPYQSECVDAIFREWEQGHQSTLVVKATGLGKTVTFSEVVRRAEGGSIIVAHREELIKQAAKHLRSIGVPCTIEMGDYQAVWSDLDRDRPVILASVQSLSRPRRQERIERDMLLYGVRTPNHLIIDEAHHATAGTYGECIRWCDKIAAGHLRLLGVTATPNRSDDAALGRVFSSVAYQYDIAAAIPDGWLCPIEPHAIFVEDLDFSRVSSAAGDLNESQLEAILTEEKHLHDVALPTVEIGENRQTLVFCVTVRHAEMLSMVLNRYYRDRGMRAQSAFLSGATDKKTREETVEAYKAGDITCLCNCALFLEGFDAPSTSVVVMARPTKSLALYTQVVGRGTRPLAGTVDGLDWPDQRRSAIASSAKPRMLLLDFVGNCGEHKLCSSADVLGGNYDEDVRTYAARQVQEEGHAPDAQEALARAADELALIKEEADRRARVVAKNAEYSHEIVDPFGGPPSQPKTQQAPRNPATDKQVNYVMHLTRRLGLNWKREDIASKSKAAVGKIIDDLQKRLQREAVA